MKIVQVVLDDEVLALADEAARSERLNRSQLVRKAITEYCASRREPELEERHRRGYAEHPVEAGEFDVWDAFLGAEE